MLILKLSSAIKAKITKKGDNLEHTALVNQVVEEMQGLKAEEITVLDLRELDNSVTNFFVLCNATSSTHAEGIAGAIHKGVSRVLQEKPWHKEDSEGKSWILMDYVSCVVHIFLRDTREYYNIEDLWSDAKRTDVIEE